MNFLQATGAPITSVLNGTTYTFTPLTLRQCGELIAEWSKTERAVLLATLKEAGVPPLEIVKQVRTFDWECSRLSYGVERAHTPNGIIRTLEVASGGKLPEGIAVNTGIVMLAMKLWDENFGKDTNEPPKTQDQSLNATG